MTDLAGGFYAYFYYMYAGVIKAFEEPFFGNIFEVLLAVCAWLSVLVIGRVITSRQLILLSFMLAFSPMVIKKLLFGNLTGWIEIMLDATWFILMGRLIYAGAVLLIVYLIVWVFLHAVWKTRVKQWIGHGILLLAFLCIIPASLVIFTYHYLSPRLAYAPDVAFQWYGELLAAQSLLFLVWLTIPALIGAISWCRGYRYLNILVALAILASLIFVMTWSADFIKEWQEIHKSIMLNTVIEELRKAWEGLKLLFSI